MLTRGLFVVMAVGSSALADNVYVFSTGNASVDAEYRNALVGAGHTPTTGVPWSAFDGSVSLSGFDAVIMNHSANWGGSSQQVPTAGQQQLVDFVNNGGGLITTEWIIYNYFTSGQNAYATLYPILPAQYGQNWNSGTQTTFTAVSADPIMNAGLPGAFLTSIDNFAGTETKLIAKPGATVFFESSNLSLPGSANHGVTGWDVGAGRVISFSTMPGLTSLGNANYARLLGNSVNWVVPAPSAASLLALGGVLAARRRR